MEGPRRILALAYPANTRTGGGRGLRRTAASEDPPDVGVRRSAGDHDEGAAPGALSRQAVFIRIPSLSAPGGPGEAVPPARSREAFDRPEADRGLHDGSRERGERDGVSSSGSALLQPLRRRHRDARARADSPAGTVAA